MRVYVLSQYYDNCQEYDSNINGDMVMGVFSTYDKAKQAAFEFTPNSFNVADESERKVTETVETVHICNGTVRTLKEYVDEYHQYEYELYITEMELDTLRVVD